jgi:hypothetical protein
MTDIKLHFKLVLGLVVIFAVGLLYHIFNTRNKLLEGVDATLTNQEPAAAVAPGAASPAAAVAPGAASPTGAASPAAAVAPGAASPAGPAVPQPLRRAELIAPALSNTQIKIEKENGKATLDITNLRTIPETESATETIFYIYIPDTLQLSDYKRLTVVNKLTNSISYDIDDYIIGCDSTAVNDLFFSDVRFILTAKEFSNSETVKKCSNLNKIKIISTHPASSQDEIVHSFKLQGFELPQLSPIPVRIETFLNNVGFIRNTYTAIFPQAITQNVMQAPDAFTSATFKVDLSDATPGAKDVTVKYTFKFTPTTASGFIIEKNDSVIHFVFSDDFSLPPVENVKVAVNNVLLDAGKNEYVLQQKNTCITPSKESLLFLDSSYKFEGENKVCIKIYTLFIKQNIPVQSTGLTIALKGLTNPSYSPSPVAYDKKDFLFRAFNTSYCILNLKVKDVGKYLFNPKTDDYIHAGIYMRGNYPLNNKKPSVADAVANDGDSKIKSSSSSSNSIESRGGSSRAANVYTVNYFYDGQGQGEYGYIARPDIFGTTPYSYGTSRGGIGTSDKYIAKQNRDLAEEKRLHSEKVQQWKESQIRPPMGVAPALLNAGVQPYDATINL